MKIGIIGGGQLGRMITLAGYPLGLQFKIWTDSKDLATSSMAEQVEGPFTVDANDHTEKARLEARIHRFTEGLDAVTFEWENLPVDLAKKISMRVPQFFPSADILEVIQDRSLQKNFFQSLKIATAPFVNVNSILDLESGLKKLGYPAILKTAKHGYDGKGQCLIRSKKDLLMANEWITKNQHQHFVLEGFVDFECELSLVAVQGNNAGKKNAVFYSLVENEHESGILQTTWAPARLSPVRTKKLQTQAEKIAKTIFKKLNYTGTMTLEFFLVKGQLWVNEMAARVHNSGHWTIEGAETSQFENHLRAGLGLPLGSTKLVSGYFAMVNILGKFPDIKKVLSIPGVHFHHYAKSEAPLRKIGHVTVSAVNPVQLAKKIKLIKKFCD